jgi:hypothetical protein
MGVCWRGCLVGCNRYFTNNLWVTEDNDSGSAWRGENQRHSLGDFKERITKKNHHRRPTVVVSDPTAGRNILYRHNRFPGCSRLLETAPAALSVALPSPVPLLHSSQSQLFRIRSGTSAMHIRTQCQTLSTLRMPEHLWTDVGGKLVTGGHRPEHRGFAPTWHRYVGPELIQSTP